MPHGASVFLFQSTNPCRPNDRSQLRLHFPPALRNFGPSTVTYIAHREPCTDSARYLRVECYLHLSLHSRQHVCLFVVRPPGNPVPPRPQSNPNATCDVPSPGGMEPNCCHPGRHQLPVFQSWPGLTASLSVNISHLPLPRPVHLHQDRQNVRPTKQPTNSLEPAVALAIRALPFQPTNSTSLPTRGRLRAYEVCSCPPHHSYRKISTKLDASPSPPANSIMVLYDYDSNSILTEALKSTPP
jgi:hypothetical protein